MLEPAVIGDVGQKVGGIAAVLRQDEVPRQFSNRVLETNQRRDMDLILRQMKDCVFGTDIEITRDLVADNLGEQWHRVSSRNVFPKRDKMEFAINLKGFP